MRKFLYELLWSCCAAHLPLIDAERDALFGGLHLAILLVVLSDVDQNHALELAYVHELFVAQLLF